MAVATWDARPYGRKTMRKKIDRYAAIRQGAAGGFVYIFTNPAMPGLVKVGYTQKDVYERKNTLKKAGVPQDFVVHDYRFFIDCFRAEERMHESLEKECERIGKSEFFKICKKRAAQILEGLSLSQCRGKNEFEDFVCMASASLKNAQQNELHWIVEGHRFLFEESSKELRLELGRSYMELSLEFGNQALAMWLVRNGVDPDEPVEISRTALNKVQCSLESYRLSAFALSIWLGYNDLRKFLDKRGCNLNDPPYLPLVIDAMINTKLTAQRKLEFADFAVDLIRYGADLEMVADVSLFAATRRHRTYDHAREYMFDLYPRNSGRTCRQIIEERAAHDNEFARLNRFFNEDSASQSSAQDSRLPAAG